MTTATTSVSYYMAEDGNMRRVSEYINKAGVYHNLFIKTISNLILWILSRGKRDETKKWFLIRNCHMEWF